MRTSGSRMAAWCVGASRMRRWCSSLPVASRRRTRSSGPRQTRRRQWSHRSSRCECRRSRARSRERRHRPRKYPSSAEAHYLFGLVSEAEGDLAGASGALEQAVSLSPNHAEAHDRLGFVLGRQGRPPRRSASLRARRRSTRSSSTPRSHLGATRWWTRDITGALAPLQAAVRLQPGHAEAHCYLGLTLEALGRIQPAIEELQSRDQGESRVRRSPRAAGDSPPVVRRSRRSDRSARSRVAPRSFIGGRAKQPRTGTLSKRTR